MVKALKWRAAVVAKNCQSNCRTSLPQKGFALLFYKLGALIFLQ